jgi:hypothetical protein
MLTRPVNVPTGRPPSPHIRARNTSPDGTANGSAGVNSAPDVDAGVNSATHLGRQRCRDHEDPGDSTKYRKLAKHRALLAQYLFDSLHDWHLKVLLVAAEVGHFVHIFFERLQINHSVVALGIIVTAQPGSDKPRLTDFVMHELVTVHFRNIHCHLGLSRVGGCKGKDG